MYLRVFDSRVQRAACSFQKGPLCILQRGHVAKKKKNLQQKLPARVFLALAVHSASASLTRVDRLGCSSCVCVTDFYLLWDLQGGKNPEDALSLQVTFRKRALYLVALLRTMTCNLRHPMGLCHPVAR